MDFRAAVVNAFMLLIQAEEAIRVDDLPCKAASLEAQGMLSLFELLKADLDLSEGQLEALNELKQYN